MFQREEKSADQTVHHTIPTKCHPRRMVRVTVATIMVILEAVAKHHQWDIEDTLLAIMVEE
jgi:hypothetical protein